MFFSQRGKVWLPPDKQFTPRWRLPGSCKLKLNPFAEALFPKRKKRKKFGRTGGLFFGRFDTRTLFSRWFTRTLNCYIMPFLFAPAVNLCVWQMKLGIRMVWLRKVDSQLQVVFCSCLGFGAFFSGSEPPALADPEREQYITRAASTPLPTGSYGLASDEISALKCDTRGRFKYLQKKKKMSCTTVKTACPCWKRCYGRLTRLQHLPSGQASAPDGAFSHIPHGNNVASLPAGIFKCSAQWLLVCLWLTISFSTYPKP